MTRMNLMSSNVKYGPSSGVAVQPRLRPAKLTTACRCASAPGLRAASANLIWSNCESAVCAAKGKNGFLPATGSFGAVARPLAATT